MTVKKENIFQNYLNLVFRAAVHYVKGALTIVDVLVEEGVLPRMYIYAHIQWENQEAKIFCQQASFC